jgi:chromosomal replication initiation ATPase DnaA
MNKILVEIDLDNHSSKIISNNNIGLYDLINIITNYFKISFDEIKSSNISSNKRDYYLERRILCYYIKLYFKLSYPVIADLLNYEKHESVIAAINKINHMIYIKEDKIYLHHINNINKILNEYNINNKTL